MSILLRAAILGGIAYYITRSLTGTTMSVRRSAAAGGSGGSGGRAALRRELHPGENNVWPTSQSQQAAAAENAGPSS
jgi:uncharacterized membrane protein